jgi:hypothetical protein
MPGRAAGACGGFGAGGRRGGTVDVGDVAFALSLVGAAISAAGSVWLLVGVKPDDPRYQVGAGARYGQADFPGIRNLVRAQQKAGAAVAIGATLQLLGLAVSVWA